MKQDETPPLSSYLLAGFWPLAISGLALGWLVGMTATPNVQNLISTILTLLVGILSILTGLKIASHSVRGVTMASLWPVAGFMGGMLLGSAIGVFVRNNDLLGPNPAVIAWRLGVHQNALMERDLLVKTARKTIEQNQNKTFLYEGITELCGLRGLALRNGLMNMDTSRYNQVLIEKSTDSTLLKLRDEYCNRKD